MEQNWKIEEFYWIKETRRDFYLEKRGVTCIDLIKITKYRKFTLYSGGQLAKILRDIDAITISVTQSRIEMGHSLIRASGGT